MKVYNDRLYGVRLSNEEIKKDRINKQSLSNMIDIILCNAIANEEDFIYSLYDTISEDNADYVYGLTDSELLEEYENYNLEPYTNEIKDDNDREKMQDNLLEYMNEFVGDYYQYFITDKRGRDTIKQFFPRETIVYYERLDVYVWCINHWGMSWKWFYSDKKISEI